MLKYSRTLRHLPIWVSLLAFSANAQLRITEFMADNESTLMDEDGDFSDWIELQNISTTNVNLHNWSLTDSAGSPTKWRLPSTNVPPGGYLIVFASGKDRGTPGAKLHTNFKLSAGGEYFALFRPDATLATEFSPEYPSQFPDVSYGIGQQIVRTTLVASNAPVRVRIPVNALEDELWPTWDFADGDWLTGTNGVGYETGLTDPAEENFGTKILASGPVAYWQLGELSGTLAANAASTGSSMDGSFNGSVTLGEPGPRPPQFTTLEPDNAAPDFDGSSGYVDGPAGLLSGLGQFTIAGWVWLDGNQSSRSGLFGQNDVVEFGFWDAGTTLRAWTPAGEVNAPTPLSTNTWHHITLAGSTTDLVLYVNGSHVASTPVSVSTFGSSADTFRIAGAGIFGSASDTYLDGLVDEVAVWHRALSAGEVADLLSTNISSVNYSPYIATDVESMMQGNNASAYVRLPFSLVDPSGITGLKLRMRYDDGVVALLNGEQMASVNAPITNAWNSAATLRHPDLAAVAWEEFDVSASRFFLRAGTNVLGLHGLNINTTNTDFLLQAELEGESAEGTVSSPRYFTLASPGSPNGAGLEDLGPILSAVSHWPAVPLSTDSLEVTTRVTEAFAPVASVTLTYRVMFGSEVSVPMNDAGTSGDVAAGDGVWTAAIPAAAAAPGEMIRYFVSAVDADVNASRWPIFPHPTDSEEYLGTVAIDPTTETLLPVLQVFIEDFSAANNDVGTRASLFYGGELYDNVRITLHGQSSSSWPKKGYNFDFNSEHRFEYEPGQPRQRDIKMLSSYGDKTRLHTSLAYEMIAQAGGDAHFSFPIRVHVNGAFFGIEDLVEDADLLFLERIGRDPNGALYKLGRPIGNSGNLEKKTRTWEGNADLSAFASAIDMSLPLPERAQFAWDNVDIPQTVNYFATLAILSSQDHGHKNFYLYRDSDGNGEWSPLPWDVDLTFGRNWVGGTGYFSDTLYTNNHLEFLERIPNKSGNDASNRLYNLFFDYPDFRKMYLRRLRTLMDTQLMPPGTPTNQLVIEPRMRERLDRFDPPGIATTDADLDQLAWGPTWGNAAYSDPRVEVERTIAEHLPGRRNWLFNSPSATVRGENIPPAQPAFPLLTLASWDYNPVSANQDQEYVEVHNPNGYAVDVTNWELDGGARFRFRAGTVIPAGQSLYLSPNVVAFRSRTNSPAGGQGFYVQGPYEGHLNAWGETLLLLNPSGLLVDSNAFVGLPSDAQRFLRVTEVMYNPSPAPGITNDAQQFEFIELKNISATVTLDLSGVRFTNGIYFDFTGGAVTNLLPGESVLVVRNLAMFAARYGAGLNVAGEFAGALDNGGETLRLEDAVGEKILEFRYNDSWQPITDGLGFSAVIVDDQVPWNTWDNPSNWRVSGTLNGSPGATNAAPPTFSPIIVNEVLTHTDLPQLDSVELYNPTPNPVDIGGWFLTDDFYTPRKYRIAEGTTIPAYSYRLFDESHFNTGSNAFRFSELGEFVYLLSGDPGTNLSGYHHGYEFGEAPNGVSLGRHTNSQGTVRFVLQSALTLNAANAYPRVGPLVVSEIMYRPPDTNGMDNDLDEFIEVQNIAGTNVPLYDPGNPTNAWRLRNAVDFDFPSGQTLNAGEHLLIVGFDPTNAIQLNAFKSRYNVPGGVSIYGPWEGKLDNSDETIELKQPGAPEATQIVPYYMIDKVAYRDDLPWSTGADGIGNSLQRVSNTGYGNDPTNWFAAGVTAGAATVPNIAPTITMTSPTNGALIVSSNGITVSVVGSDNDGSLTLVQLFANDTELARWTADALNYVWSAAPSGTHSLKARATDDLGAVTESPLVTIQLNSAPPPTATLLSPTDGAILLGSSSVMLSANATSGGGPAQTVTYYLDGSPIGSAAAPFDLAWVANPPGPHVLSAVATDSEQQTSPPNPITVFIQAASIDPTPVPANSTWNYLDDGSDQGTGWTNLTFNTNSWSGGPGQLGYGDGDEATLISFGGDSNDKHITYYFRKTFVIPSRTGITGVELSILRDDGAIAYLNGTEVYREDMPTGTVDFETLASGTVSGDDEQTYHLTSLAPSLLQVGTNILAVEVHQGSVSSSDVSFDAELALQGAWYGPAITSQPASQSVDAGSNVTFTVNSLGTSPLSYQWFFNDAEIGTGVSLALNAVQVEDAGAYFVVVTNGFGVATSSTANLTITGTLPDTDGDGMPNAWEQANGTNPTVPDGGIDLDGDSLTNLEEYLAGTSPTNAASVLRFETMSVSGSDAVLSFSASSNLSYTIQKGSLAGAWQDWTNISSAPSNRAVWLTNAINASQEGYYRLHTPASP